MSKQIFRTPKGEIRWAYLTGQGKKNLNGIDEFTLQIVVPADEAEEAISQIETFWNENKPKGAKEPKSTGYKTDEKGNVVFTLKTKTVYQDGTPKEIRIFNAKAEQVKLPDGVRVGNGSRGRASGIMAIYDGGVAARGVTLYLDAVQLTKFQSYAGPDSGFEEEEGEFEDFRQRELTFTADDDL